ncbi:MAG: SulP family inorganic anion transporter [Nannocystaceae bacterium]|nr:solute carrier family 26 protein [bacterium]
MTMATLDRIIPAAAWLRAYERGNLRADLVAGLTTAVMLIPQAMAYAMLAGLPPTVGLYASTLPLVLYAVFGSSRELAVGPVAMDSLLVATTLAPIAAAGSPEYVALAGLLALMVGVIAAGLGLARAGFLVNFLSRPVVSGFTSAAALIIGLSQLEHLLGVELPRSSQVFVVLAAAARALGEVHLPTVLLGASSIGALVALKAYVPKLPRGLLVVAAATVSVWVMNLGARGVAVVGDVPAGLPALSAPALDLAMIAELAPAALVIALVAFMEAVSVAKAYAARRGYAISPNQELIGIGVANVGAACVGGYPVTGGFSRTAVNAQAGARTPLAGLVTAGVVVAALLFLTPVFTQLPKAVLAAVIMTAVFGLIDVAHVRHLWRVDRADLALLVITFVATLGLGIQVGIGVGVVASLLWFVVQATRPHAAVLGRLRGTTAYRNVERHPNAERIEGVLILRIDASFYFGNVSFLEDLVRDTMAEQEPPVHTVIVDGSSINRLDSSASAAVGAMAKRLRGAGVALILAGLKGPVIDALERGGVYDDVCGRASSLTVHDAVRSVLGTPPPSDQTLPLRNAS